MISLIVLLIPVGIVALALTLSAWRKHGESGEFPQRIRTIYMYMVMVVSLIITIIGFVFAWNNTVNLIIPRDAGATNVQRATAQRNQAVSGLATSIATIVVGGAVFVYHGKKVKE